MQYDSVFPPEVSLTVTIIYTAFFDKEGTGIGNMTDPLREKAQNK